MSFRINCQKESVIPEQTEAAVNDNSSPFYFTPATYKLGVKTVVAQSQFDYTRARKVAHGSVDRRISEEG